MMTPDGILVAESCFPGSNSFNLTDLDAARCLWRQGEVDSGDDKDVGGKVNVICRDEYSLRESKYDTEPI
jgi:hypothetical protein